MKIRYLISVATATAILPASLLNAPSALAQVTNLFTINNNTGRDVIAIYLTPEGGRRKDVIDVLGNSTLGEGERIRVKLKLARACTKNREAIYTLQTEMARGGNTSEVVDVCEGSYSLGGNQPVSKPDNQPISKPDNRPVSKPETNPLPLPTTPLPSVFVSLNPSQPVAPNVFSSINGALSGRGLSPASCSASPVVTLLVNNQYTACAYPTPSIPAGRYEMNMAGL